MKNKTDENQYKYNSKIGISLMILIITIIVILILVSTVVISTTNAINIAKLTTFTKNLNSIQDAAKSYYATNNVMPTLTGYNIINKDELVSISKFQNILIDELTENKDLDSQFYVIDLTKINVTQTSFGDKKLGENDILVISYPTMNIYYPYGLDVNNTVYFSITSKITSVIKIDQNQISNPIYALPLIDRIQVTQASGWVNEMDVNIKVNIAENEELFMSVSGDTNRLITTTIGENILKFDSLSSIVNDTEIIKVPTLTFEEANYIESENIPISEKYVDILKYKNSKLIDKVRIDLSNYSKTSPTIKSATLFSSFTVNEVNLSLDNSDSGIKEVRYEYLTRYTDDGTIDNYYNNVSDFDPLYMKDKAKKANITDSFNTTIKAPKNVQSIKVVVIDKANNISLYNQEIAPRLYIGYSIDNYTKGSLQLTANVFSANGVKTISFSKSSDGINFTDEQVYTLNTTTNGTTTKQCMPYGNILQDSAYIKIVSVNYDNTSTETRIVPVNLRDVVLPVSTWDNPKIPLGFSKSTLAGETEVLTGLVIIDNINKNEFVWVPVEDFNKFVRVEYNKGTKLAVCEEATWDGVSNITELDKIYKSVKDNGGFYIARYEAGIDEITSPTKKDHKTILNGTIKPVSKAGRGTWNFIKWGTTNDIANPGDGAVTVARSMYNTPDIASNLVYGVQWDAALEFIKTVDSIYVVNSTGQGNYTNKLAVTGADISYKFNNIYDMAGNEYEWTMESVNDNHINRGGSYSVNGKGYPSSYRRSTSIGSKNANLSFRCALYLK